MSELMVLLQALLLIAGWLLFLRAQTELRAQAARQSLTGELEELRQTVDALLQRLIEEAAQAEARIEARLRELEPRGTGVPPVQMQAPLLERDAQATAPCGTGVPPVQMQAPLLERDAQATARGTGVSPVQTTLQAQTLERDAQATGSETFSPDSGYNLSGSETSPYGVVAILAEQGLSVPEIARQTGYAPGEVELILNLKRRSTEENG
jgi:hypothetical protein